MAKEVISSWLPPRGWAMHKAVREEGPLCRARRRRRRRFCMGRAGKPPPGPAGPRLRGGGPDGQAGDRRRRIQGGRREAPPFARGRPLQRRGRRLLDIRVPEHEDGPRDAGGPRGRARWRRRPAAAFGHGPAAPDVPACRLALERTGIARPMSRKGSRLDNAKAENFFSMAKTEPCCDWEGRPRRLRGGSGEAYRPV